MREFQTTKKINWGIALLFFISLAFLGRNSYADRIEYTESDPTPTGMVKVASPTLLWKISLNEGAQVTAVQLSLNSNAVIGSYVKVLHAVSYTPAEPLKPGLYSVHCHITINDEFDIDKDWQFTVSDDAIETLNAPDSDDEVVLNAINDIRHRLQLPDLIVDKRLCAAAMGHSAYLARNQLIGHEQNASLPGFIAANTEERVGAYGFPGATYESVSQGIHGVKAVVSLFDAPYHRAPFLQPGSLEVGAGISSDVVTLLFGVCDDSAVLTYPQDGQADVPTRWSGIETPNPMRVHGATSVVQNLGYVITLFYFSPENPRLTVQSATLSTSDGISVPIYLNTPDNDDFLQNAVLLIPKKPLRAATTYRVNVRATDDIGDDRSKSWSFKTASTL